MPNRLLFLKNLLAKSLWFNLDLDLLKFFLASFKFDLTLGFLPSGLIIGDSVVSVDSAGSGLPFGGNLV